MLSAHQILPCLLFMDVCPGLKTQKITPNICVFDSQTSLKFCNRVYHNTAPTARDVEAVVNYFNLRPFTWAVEQIDYVTQKIVEQFQFERKATFPAMRLKMESYEPFNSNLDIREINCDVADFVAWVDAIKIAFNTNHHEFEQATRMFCSGLDVHLYAGYCDGKVIAGGMGIYHSSNIVSLHWIGTMPAMRNQGFARAISHKILYDAQKRNYTLAILLASEMGKPVYQKLGFEEYAGYCFYGN